MPGTPESRFTSPLSQAATTSSAQPPGGGTGGGSLAGPAGGGGPAVSGAAKLTRPSTTASAIPVHSTPRSSRVTVACARVERPTVPAVSQPSSSSPVSTHRGAAPHRGTTRAGRLLMRPSRPPVERSSSRSGGTQRAPTRLVASLSAPPSSVRPVRRRRPARSQQMADLGPQLRGERDRAQPRQGEQLAQLPQRLRDRGDP